MIPLIIDPAKLRIALVGTGPLALRRLELLRAGGAGPAVFAPGGDGALEALAGETYQPRMPDAADLAGVHVLFVAGLADDAGETLAAEARALGILVNVEDVIPLCDFHVPSIVRRGDLLLTVSTRGRTPGLSRLLRLALERLFPAVWAKRLDRAADLRERMRAEGADGAAINRAVELLATEEGWLP